MDEEYTYDPKGNRLSAGYTDNNPITVQAYWRLNDAAGTTTADASGNALTASFGGTPAWITTGLPPKIFNNPAGLYFDSAGDFLIVSNRKTRLRVSPFDSPQIARRNNSGRSRSARNRFLGPKFPQNGHVAT